jgi:ferredoxin-NADP reductase
VISADRDGGRFQIAVEEIAGGRVSAYVHAARVGSELSMTGPWSKFHPAAGDVGRAFLLATDTGITAAIGLARGVRFGPMLAATTIAWLRRPGHAFLPDAMVRSWIPDSCRLIVEDAAPIGDPARIARARALLAAHLGGGDPGHGYFAGDGAVNYALLEDGLAAGMQTSRDRVETFFNMPKRPVT